MILRFKFQPLGGHVHVRVFSALSARHHFAKCGDLTFNEGEWPFMARALATAKLGPGTDPLLDVIVQVMPEEP